MNKLPLDKLKTIELLAFDYDGVFTDGTILIDAAGNMLRQGHAKDGFAVQWACKQGIPLAIITGGREPSVEARMRGLGIEEVHLGCHDKLAVLSDLSQRSGIPLESMAYMGDDMPDKLALQHVGLSCCPADAAADILPLCDYVSSIKGGHGCVRELIEGFMKAKGVWNGKGQTNW
ncbi:MAG: KdsC family phosphatase [Flavobacteriales bacterium]